MAASLNGGSVRVLWDADDTAEVTITGGGSAVWTVNGSTVTFPYTLSSSTTFETTHAGSYDVSVEHHGYEVASTPDGTRNVELRFGEQVIFSPTPDGTPNNKFMSDLHGSLSATYGAPIELARTDQAPALQGFWTYAADADTAAVDVMAIGTSMLSGVSSGGEKYKITTRLIEMLRRRFGQTAIGGRGWRPGNEQLYGGPVINFAPYVGADGTPVNLSLGNRATQMAPTTMATWKDVDCTSFPIYFQTTTGDSLTIKVTNTVGGATVDEQTITPGTVTRHVHTPALPARGHYRIDITCNAGSPILLGAMEYRGDEDSGIRYVDCTKGGASSDDWLAAEGGSEDWLNYIGTGGLFTPRLVIIDAIPNDATTLTAVQHEANVRALITKVRSKVADVGIVLLGMHRRNPAAGVTLVDAWDDYVEAERKIARDTARVAIFDADKLVDITHRDNFFINGTETYHPGPAGQALIADVLFEFVSPPGTFTNPDVAAETRTRPVRQVGVVSAVQQEILPAPVQLTDIWRVASNAAGTAFPLRVDSAGAPHAMSGFSLDGNGAGLTDLRFHDDEGVVRLIVRKDASGNLQILTRDSSGGAVGTPLQIANVNGQVTITGNVRMGTDNAYDIGNSGSSRPRYVRAGTGVQTGAVATGSRPTASAAGAGTSVFDTTLGKPIWSTGSAWVDATGTVV